MGEVEKIRLAKTRTQRASCARQGGPGDEEPKGWGGGAGGEGRCTEAAHGPIEK